MCKIGTGVVKNILQKMCFLKKQNTEVAIVAPKPQIKMGATKNQHFVPQFYQRLFSDDGKLVGTYLINSGRYVQSPIKNQASKDYMYSSNQNFENALTILEGHASKVIEAIITNPRNPILPKDYSTLYIYIMMQFARTNAFANLLAQAEKSFVISVLKALPNIEQEVKEAAEKVIQVNEPGAQALQMMAKMVSVCMDLDYKMLIKKESTPFITSDNPVCLYNFLFERLGITSYGLGSRGLCMYFPISSEIAIILYDSLVYKIGKRNEKVIEITKSDVLQLNKIVSINADNILLYKNSLNPQSEIDRIMLGITRSKGIQIKDVSKPSENGVIIGNVAEIPQCGAKLTFIKEMDRTKCITSQNMIEYLPYLRNRNVSIQKHFHIKTN